MPVDSRTNDIDVLWIMALVRVLEPEIIYVKEVTMELSRDEIVRIIAEHSQTYRKVED